MILPSLAAILSIGIAPIGAEGLLLQQCKSLEESKKSFAMRASIAKWVILLIVVILGVAASKSTDDEQLPKGYEASIVVMMVLLLIVCFVAAVNAIRSWKSC